MVDPRIRFRAVAPLALGLAFVLTPIPGIAPGGGGGAAAQSTLERTPNLEGPWVGSPGTFHFNLVHRFWRVGTPDEQKLLNSPTFLMAAPLPGRVMAGARLASNSLVAANRFNEWEFLARWAPLGAVGSGGEGAAGRRDPDQRLRLGLTAAWNAAAGSADGEIAASAPVPLPEALPVEGIRVLGAVRGYQDALGLGDSGWSGAVGAVVRLGENVAVTGDVGTFRVGDASVGRSWGVGLQLGIPTTPHTISIQATNTRTSTLQGSASPDRTFWGFEFTVPVVLSRYVPGLRGRGSDTDGPTQPLQADGSSRAEVTMTDDMRFVPDTLRIEAGTVVTWRNTSRILHTVTAHPDHVRDQDQIGLPAGAEPFDSGDLFPGDVFAWRFEVPGTYRYVCLPHDRIPMIGVVIVDP
jgi:plastocyanin